MMVSGTCDALRGFSPGKRVRTLESNLAALAGVGLKIDQPADRLADIIVDECWFHLVLTGKLSHLPHDAHRRLMRRHSLIS
jgi:hypothetical protein